MNEKRPLFRKGDSGPVVAEICDRLVRIGAIEKSSNFIDESIEALKSINNTFGGQITGIYDNGKGNERTVQITVKVPVEKFEVYYDRF